MSPTQVAGLPNFESILGTIFPIAAVGFASALKRWAAVGAIGISVRFGIPKNSWQTRQMSHRKLYFAVVLLPFSSTVHDFVAENFSLKPARFATPMLSTVRVRSNTAVSCESTQTRGNFAFIEAPLKPGAAVVVELTALKRRSPVPIVLTSKDAHHAYSCDSLARLCETTYSIRIESEIPEAEDELAVRISTDGAVYISHDGRTWMERARVDTALEYHVVFDMEHIYVLYLMGIATGLGGFKENEVVLPSVPSERSPQRDSSSCVICLEKPRNVVILPCFHVALCDDCVRSLQKSTEAECPVCRLRITGVEPFYSA